MKYVHTNIVSVDVQRLAEFYIKVFDCKQTRPQSQLYGDWVEKGTGVKGANIKQIDLQLPGYNSNPPMLEIFEYAEKNDDNTKSPANLSGIRHLAFNVDSVENTLKGVIDYGGKTVGELTLKEFKSGFLTFIYVADPEGNLIEIQSWKEK